MPVMPGEEHLDEPTPEPIALAMLRHLRQMGVLDHNDVIAIADDLDEEGETEAAHDVRLTAIDVTPQSEYDADRRRAQMRSITGGKDD